jgi:uncharacterized membrane protein YczE
MQLTVQIEPVQDNKKEHTRKMSRRIWIKIYIIITSLSETIKLICTRCETGQKKLNCLPVSKTPTNIFFSRQFMTII